MRKTETAQNRKDLARLFKGVGAEIGVERGMFARHILQTASKLFCIDSWESYDDYRGHVSAELQKRLFGQTVERLKPYDCVIIRKKSLDAVRDFDDESLDFVYIDANHDYEQAREDIEAWSKKVKRGGIVSGHDYIDGSGKNPASGVFKLVNQLKEDLIIWKGDDSHSWSYVKK